MTNEKVKMQGVNFTKMVASGNDFVVIEKSRRAPPKYMRAGIVHSPQKLAKEICDRRYGVGADGLLLLEKSKKADFKMRIINPDGSEAEMCGNGARCIALYANQRRLAAKDMRFETLAGIIEARVSEGKVRLKMSEPRDIKLKIKLKVKERVYEVFFVNTGVPHAVIFVKDIEAQEVKEIGRDIRYHRVFAPKGTNVNFVEAGGGNLLKVRTYERGVEDETPACGTGVTASAIIAALVKNFKSPASCLTKSKEALKVYFGKSGDNFKDVYLEGGAKTVFCGRYYL